MRGKYKRRRNAEAITFISLLLVCGALLPAMAHAALFADLFATLSGTAEAKSDSSVPQSATLQNLALPTPAMNINPAPAIGGGDITIVNGTALLPEEGPSGTIADIDKPANSTVRIYTVNAGDTLESVARQQGVPEGILLSYNDLTRETQLQPGQRLVILPTPSVRYTVKSGDTIESIAKKTGGDAQEIALANGIDNTTLIAGQTIDVPNGEASAAPETPSKPKTKNGGVRGRLIPLAHNPAEPAHNVGAPGTLAEIAYYISPLTSYVQSQGIHGYNAVDLAAPEGTAIRAAAGGTVVVAREGGWNGGYGSYVVISHSNGSQTLYGHMSKVDVYDGETVGRGQTIGLVGETGEATGPHVHFEIRNGIRNPF